MWYCWLFLFCPPDEQKWECGCGLFDHWWNLLSFPIFTDWFYFFCEFTGHSFACFLIWLVVFSGRIVASLHIVEISTPLLSLYVINIFPWSVLCFLLMGFCTIKPFLTSVRQIGLTFSLWFPRFVTSIGEALLFQYYKIVFYFILVLVLVLSLFWCLFLFRLEFIFVKVIKGYNLIYFPNGEPIVTLFVEYKCNFYQILSYWLITFCGSDGLMT